MKKKTRRAITGYIFVMPWLIGFILLTIYPLFYSLFLSFQDVNFSVEGIRTTFVGLKHYNYAFRVDTQFPTLYVQSLIDIGLSVPLIIIFSLIIAILLNQAFFGRTFFRAVYFLPVVIISGPVLSELLTNRALSIVDPNSFFVYRFLSTLPSFINFPFLYIFDNLITILWFSGVQIVFFLAGLQRISTNIYEAAQIDGANAWVIFWKIILPLIKPFVLVNAIYTIVDLSSFPNNPINTSIATNMFNFQRPYVYSSALAWIHFLTTLGFILVALLLLRDRKRAL
ncbi:MAG TPA: sugar ABC transporter permease [Fervidobacterium sp.]|nr:sugar ABC transporter permease [Fervidobacterium sp.]HPT54125.1 sugar ABC transporter permease [Fervidobacterium sp.]HPZ17387.1 sugar ABC transporter permease [Fervidobacterium sp.]HUM42492.1 sugar ABC transporter permease [Fervidobacterium sp.]